CSARVVEPTTSAKRAVTGLRSPVRRAVRILVMSGAGAAAAIFEWVAASAVDASANGFPQFAQNLASCATLASRRGQVRDGDSTVIGRASYPTLARSQFLNKTNARSILGHAQSSRPTGEQRSLLRSESAAGDRSRSTAPGGADRLPSRASRGSLRRLRRSICRAPDGLRSSRSQRKEFQSVFGSRAAQEPRAASRRGGKV